MNTETYITLLESLARSVRASDKPEVVLSCLREVDEFILEEYRRLSSTTGHRPNLDSLTHD